MKETGARIHTYFAPSEATVPQTAGDEKLAAQSQLRGLLTRPGPMNLNLIVAT